MRFQVPQFIDVEDKIFGPLTLKQFIYLAGGAGLSFVVYELSGSSLVISTIPIILIIGGSVALAFYRYNSKPLISILESAFNYWRNGKLYIWKKTPKAPPATAAEAVRDAKSYASLTVPKISDSKLKDLSWSLDIKESIYSNKNQR